MSSGVPLKGKPYLRKGKQSDVSLAVDQYRNKQKHFSIGRGNIFYRRAVIFCEMLRSIIEEAIDIPYFTMMSDESQLDVLLYVWCCSVESFRFVL